MNTQYPDIKVSIEGYTDNTGKPESNLKLPKTGQSQLKNTWYPRVLVLTDSLQQDLVQTIQLKTIKQRQEKQKTEEWNSS
jgi:hypothetical protein